MLLMLREVRDVLGRSMDGIIIGRIDRLYLSGMVDFDLLCRLTTGSQSGILPFPAMIVFSVVMLEHR